MTIAAEHGGACAVCGCTQANAGRDSAYPELYANLVRSHIDHFLCDNCDRKAGFKRPAKCCAGTTAPQTMSDEQRIAKVAPRPVPFHYPGCAPWEFKTDANTHRITHPDGSMTLVIRHPEWDATVCLRAETVKMLRDQRRQRRGKRGSGSLDRGTAADA